MSIYNLVKNSEGLAKNVLEKKNQFESMLKPHADLAFIAAKAFENIAVLRTQNEFDDQELFIITDASTVAQVKPKAVFNADVIITKTEDGGLACHAIKLQSKSSWVLSFIEALNVAYKTPITMDRDYDAKIYTCLKEPSAQVEEIDESDIEQAFERAFGKYIIEDAEHPALKGLLKSFPTSNKAKKSKYQEGSVVSAKAVTPASTSAVKEEGQELTLDENYSEPEERLEPELEDINTEQGTNELELDLSELELDDTEFDLLGDE